MTTTTTQQAKQDASDRRAHRRFEPAELPPTTLIQIANRPPISVVDFSAGGALLTVPFQPRPESHILQVVTPREELAVPFRVLRCYVSDLSDGIRYHAAVSFEQILKLPPSFGGGLRLNRPLSTIEMLMRATRGVDLSSRGVCFNLLVSRVVDGLRRSHSAVFLVGQVRAELVQLFPSLTIVRASKLPLVDTSTSARFFGVEFRSDGLLTAEDRRFLRAGAQLIRLIDKNLDTLVQDVPSLLIIHSIAQWQALSV